MILAGSRILGRRRRGGPRPRVDGQAGDRRPGPGQVQSESPSEVVVKLGANTTAVPTDQIVSIRYDGQPATLQLAETREAAASSPRRPTSTRRRPARPRASRSSCRPPSTARPPRSTDLALVEPERIKDAKDRLLRFVRTYPTSRHIVAAREDLARLQVRPATSGRRGHDRRAGEAAQGRRARGGPARQGAGQAGAHDEAIAELDRLIAAFPDRSAQQREARLAKAESLVGMKKFKEAEAPGPRRSSRPRPPRTCPRRPPPTTPWATASAPPIAPRMPSSPTCTPTCSTPRTRSSTPGPFVQIEKLFRQLKQDGRADEYAQRLRQEYPRSPWLRAKAADR